MYNVSVWDLGRASLIQDRSRDLNRVSSEQTALRTRGRAIQTRGRKCQGSEAEVRLGCLWTGEAPVAGEV